MPRFLIVSLVAVAAMIRCAASSCADDLTKVLDPKLKLELIAEAPIVRTPTGIAIDEQGRVYVIESHTHFRPENYEGPKYDRILRFEKKEDKYESSVFFEGTTHTMGLGFHPDGSMYVATRMEIFELNDKNNNGKIDDAAGDAAERTNLVKHETAGNYPHNGLSGFAFDFAGNVYFGQGENLGASYKIVGSDGQTLSGGGEGGNIYCIKADGSKLRRVATGFWNPFAMYMDPFGRLFTVDNDPDSRPPCRLLHVVEGGDYGYRFRNGRKGTHPFTSWNGELPGTLPMVAGTGEAPSGIIGESTSSLLVTSWGDHRIERYRLKDRGASFASNMETVIVGDENFRPVAVAVDPDGSLWFTDWVDKSYQLHGKGRLWRISSKNLAVIGDRHEIDRITKRLRKMLRSDATGTELKATGLRPLASEPNEAIQQIIAALGLGIEETFASDRAPAIKAFALGGSLGIPRPLPNDIDVTVFTNADQPGEMCYAATRRLDPTKDLARLKELLGDPDPFIQQAARWALRTVADELAGFDFAHESRPGTRLGVTLVLADANKPAGHKRIPELLNDSDPLVRFVAIKWIGEERLKDVWNTVKDDLEKRLATRQELEAYLATSAFLADEKYDPGKESRGEEFIVKMLLDKNTANDRKALLLRMLPAGYPGITHSQLTAWFEGDSSPLRKAVLGWIADGVSTKYFDESNALSDTAQNEDLPLAERLEAIAAMSHAPANFETSLAKLLNDKNSLIATQAGRAIRTDNKLAAKYSIAFGKEGRPRLDDLGAWRTMLDKQPGDAKSGRLVFHHAIAQCSRCHEAEGRGNVIGPNLTNIGKSISRERLIQSILQPSKEIAPQFALWQIETRDGRTLKGMYVGEEVDGTVIYANEKGETFKVHPRDVESRTQQQQSLMPEGLPYALTDQELRDLLAYLGGEGM